MDKDKNQLYEELISCISYSVKYELNEAYENALLEEYGFKEIMSQIYDGASKTSKVLFKQIRSLLIYLIERLEKTNQYKKAQKILDEYKKRIQKYIDDNKKITPKKMLQILIAVLTIYGGVSLVQDCKSVINKVKGNIEMNDSIIEEPIPAEWLEDGFYNLADNKQDIKETSYSFQASDNAKKFIKKHERLLLYPYYATKKEMQEGKVTIGYGHVVLPTDGELYKKVQKLKAKGKITQSFIMENGKPVLNPNHCHEIITEKEAYDLFLNDVKIAERRAKKTIKDMDANAHVKDFILRNQSIMDGLTSMCYNAGYLNQNKYQFIRKGLNNCRYDAKNKCINASDYDLTFSYFKNLKQNNNRRQQEYKLFFANANNPNS